MSPSRAQALRPPRAARPARRALPAALLALACAHPQVPTVPRAPTLAASDERTAWITDRLRDLRAAERAGDRAAEGEARARLERGGVDWRSFLTPARGSIPASAFLQEQALYAHTLRQLAQKLNLVRDVRQIFGIPDRAADLAADGRVLDSAFFTNRDPASITPAELRADAAGRAPRGRIAVTRSKQGGTSEGFEGVDEAGVPFIFVFDPPEFLEMSTAAEVIGSTILRLAGYNVPYPSIVTLADLTLAPGAAEQGVTERAVARDRGRRAVATRMIAEGYGGPWTYAVFRDRRELRALQVFAAWLNNPDQVDHNTLIEIFDERAGLLRYYVIDFSGALGASSARVKDPFDGYLNNKFDFDRTVTLPLRLLAAPFGYRDPWDRAQAIVSPAVGRFDANLVPRLWKPFYPNLAYEDLDDEDAAWAARIVGAFSDELLDAIVDLGRYSNPADAAYVAATLKRRRDIIVETYLGDE